MTTTNWIDVKEKLPRRNVMNVLVAYDEPFFGTFTKEQCVAYYDR
jgi:hypothetical protein